MLSDKARNIAPSATLSINAMAKELKARGEKVYNFSAGEPDFNTPENIKKAAIRAVKENFSRYTACAGMPGLRKAVSEKFRKENGLDYAPEEIVVSNGAKHSIFNTLTALCNPGEEVAIPVPYWVSYGEMVKLVSAKPVLVRGESIKPSPNEIASKTSDKTKALLLNSPSNPTGMVYSKEELGKIAEDAAEKNYLIISDEVYEKMVFDGFEHCSIASLGKETRELTITVNAVSKTYAMTGYRVGYIGASQEIAKALSNIQGQTTSCPCAVAQVAALEALTGPQDSVKKMVKEFAKRRKFVVKKLNGIPGIKCAEPKGAFYAFPDISALSVDSAEFCRKLVEEKKVLAVPGPAFGAEGFLRISYASSMRDLEEGMNLFEEFCKSFP